MQWLKRDRRFVFVMQFLSALVVLLVLLLAFLYKLSGPVFGSLEFACFVVVGAISLKIVVDPPRRAPSNRWNRGARWVFWITCFCGGILTLGVVVFGLLTSLGQGQFEDGGADLAFASFFVWFGGSLVAGVLAAMDMLVQDRSRLNNR